MPVFLIKGRQGYLFITQLLYTAMSDTPRIWVSCLAAYNNGKLHGTWIDADQDAEDIMAEIETILKESPEPDAEEWAIHDYEGFQGISVSEQESIEKVSEIANSITEHGKAYAVYVNYVGLEYATLDDFEEVYRGCYESEEDFAYEHWEEMGIISKLEKASISESYIDWEKVATDLFIESFYSVEVSYNEVYVFNR